MSVYRGRNWKRELIKDKTYRHTISLKPMNYLRGNSYVPITFNRQAGSGIWAFDMTELQTLRIAPRSDVIRPVEMGSGDNTIKFGVVGANDVAVVAGSALNESVYPGILTNCDMHVFNGGHLTYIEFRGNLRSRTIQLSIEVPASRFDVKPGEKIAFHAGDGNPLFNLPFVFECWKSTEPDKTYSVLPGVSFSGGLMTISLTLPNVQGLNRLHPTLTLQPDGTDGVDTRMHVQTPTTNFATNANLTIGESNTGVNVVQRHLIKWDLTSLASDVTIDSTTQNYWLASAGSAFASGSNTLHLYRCLRDWVETEATWNIAFTGTSWTSGGADDTTNDRESTSRGNVSLATTDAQHDKKSITVNTTIIQNWVDGTWSNYGFVVRGATELNDLYNFYSSDEATFTTERPQLVVVYTLPITRIRNFSMLGVGK